MLQLNLFYCTGQRVGHWLLHRKNNLIAATQGRWRISLRSKRFQPSYCAKVRAGAFPFFLLTSQLFSTNSRGNACYAGWWRIQGRGPDEPVPPLLRVWMAGPPFSRSGWIRHWRLLLAALNISRRDHIFNKKLYRDMPPISTHLVNILIYNARNIFQLALTFATNY